MNSKLKEKIAKAEHRLQAVTAKVAQHQDTKFWSQCVRDNNGTWEHLRAIQPSHGVERYFRGVQRTIDYNNEAELEYLVKSISVRQAFYAGLYGIEDLNLTNFKLWLIELRDIISYEKPIGELFADTSGNTTTAHTVVIDSEVRSLAKLYGDPYGQGSSGPTFDTIPKAAHPFDTFDRNVVIHHYPDIDFCDLYLSEALHTLKQLLADKGQSLDSYYEQAAYFYQLLINLHMFTSMNTSLYMNMANGLIELFGHQGITHGIVDFVAMRFQPANFASYFKDQLLLNNQPSSADPAKQ